MSLCHPVPHDVFWFDFFCFWCVVQDKILKILSHTDRDGVIPFSLTQTEIVWYKWVMAQIRMSHVANRNEVSLLAYEWVVMSHVTHTQMSQVTDVDEACHTYEWVVGSEEWHTCVWHDSFTVMTVLWHTCVWHDSFTVMTVLWHTPPKNGQIAPWPSTNGAIPYFLVLPGSELSINEITEYTYFSLLKPSREFIYKSK